MTVSEWYAEHDPDMNYFCWRPEVSLPDGTTLNLMINFTSKPQCEEFIRNNLLNVTIVDEHCSPFGTEYCSEDEHGNLVSSDGEIVETAYYRSRAYQEDE